MLGTVLLIFLILIVFGGLGHWQGYGRYYWGHGGLGLIVVIILIVLLAGGRI